MLLEKIKGVSFQDKVNTLLEDDLNKINDLVEYHTELSKRLTRLSADEKRQRWQDIDDIVLDVEAINMDIQKALETKKQENKVTINPINMYFYKEQSVTKHSEKNEIQI